MCAGGAGGSGVHHRSWAVGLSVHPDGHPGQPHAPQEPQARQAGVSGTHQTPVAAAVLHLEGDHAEPVSLSAAILDDGHRHRRVYRPHRHWIRPA